MQLEGWPGRSHPLTSGDGHGGPGSPINHQGLMIESNKPWSTASIKNQKDGFREQFSKVSTRWSTRHQGQKERAFPGSPKPSASWGPLSSPESPQEGSRQRHVPVHLDTPVVTSGRPRCGVLVSAGGPTALLLTDPAPSCPRRGAVCTRPHSDWPLLLPASSGGRSFPGQGHLACVSGSLFFQGGRSSRQLSKVR